MADIALRIKADFAQAEKAFKTTGYSAEEMAAKVEKMQKKLGPEHIDKFMKNVKLTGAALTATKGDTVAYTAQQRMLQKEIERLVKGGINPENESLKRLQKELVDVSKKTDTTAKSQSRFGDIVKGVLAAGAIQSGLRAIKNGFVGIIDEARKLEDAEAAFTPLMGGATNARKLVDELNIAAAKTPFQFDAISKSAKQLLPVMNQDIEKTIDTFKMLGDTAGGNAQKLDSITRGFTKAMLKGKVDMESLNMIAEAGVPIFTEMASTMGYGKDQMSDFFKEISTGKVSTDIMVETFKKMTSEGGIFFEGMIIASKTTSGVFSTLADSISMTAAGIGQKFLPAIKEIALNIIKVSASILEWVKEGDNLDNLLSTMKNVLIGVTSVLAGYAVAAGIAAIANGGLGSSFGKVVMGIEAMGKAIKANPIGFIAGVITAVVIPAIIWMVKHWDLVKFHIVDFAQTASIKLQEFNLAIQKKVMGGLAKLFAMLGKLPGETGKKFKNMSVNVSNSVKRLELDLLRTKIAQKKNRAEFAKTQKAAEEEMKRRKKLSEEKNNIDDKEIDKQKQKAVAFKDSLNAIAMSQQAHNAEQMAQAEQFFSQRAELEGTNSEERLEWLREQQSKVNDLYANNNEQRLNAEKGLRQAILKEEQKITQNRVKFATTTLSAASSLVSDLQTVMENAGKKSKALAITMRAISAAEAAINSYVAFTKALAAFPPPFNYVAAGITLAAGLAKQAAILSTPISGQTGLNYTVPDTRTNQRDGFPVRAQAGETVSVTPRGEETIGMTEVNISIGESKIFRIVQRGINTGKINVSNRNIGRGVFAT